VCSDFLTANSGVGHESKIAFSREDHRRLKRADAEVPIKEFCRKHGISDATFYNWRKKYQGMEVAEAKKVKKLEDENARLKRIIGEQAIDIQMLKEVVGKKW
jgi:putative transposase